SAGSRTGGEPLRRGDAHGSLRGRAERVGRSRGAPPSEAMNPGRGLFFYTRRSSPLHAARAGVGALWALAVSAAALVLSHPLALLALLVGLLAAAAGADVWRELRRALVLALVVAIPIVAVNVLVSREGLTVFA